MRNDPGRHTIPPKDRQIRLRTPGMKPGASGDSVQLCPDPIQNSPTHITALLAEGAITPMAICNSVAMSSTRIGTRGLCNAVGKAKLESGKQKLEIGIGKSGKLGRLSASSGGTASPGPSGPTA